jgi:hypothetical protein
MDSFSTKRISQSKQLDTVAKDLGEVKAQLQRLSQNFQNLAEAANVLVRVVGQETYDDELASYRLQVTEANVARALAEGVLAESADAVLTAGEGIVFQLVERAKDTNEAVHPGKAYLEFDNLTEEGKKLLGGSAVGVVVTGPNGNTLEVTKIYVRKTPGQAPEAPAPAAPTLTVVPQDAEVVAPDAAPEA